MAGVDSRVLETVERGGRFQDSIRPDIFLYIVIWKTCPPSLQHAVAG